MMDDVNAAAEADEGPNFIGLVVSLVILALFGLFWVLNSKNAAPAWTLLYLISQVALISVVIWQACDPFADAAQWIGDTFHLPGSVRGATLDAVASSMPELFSGIFFVIVAISVAGDAAGVDRNDPEAMRVAVEQAGAEGYGSTIATCAGSAVYNMILIPAFCALVISFVRKNRPTIDVEDEVIARDGIWFVCCEIVLIVFLFGETMQWWMGLVFIGLYCIYVTQLYRDALRYRKKMRALHQHFQVHGVEVETTQVITALGESGLRVSRTLVLQAREDAAGRNGAGDEDEEEAPDSAGVAFGYLSVPLNHGTVWLVILGSTIVAAAACYYLVQTTRHTAEFLDIPAFFVAVILAAAASSVPDTFLAIGAARRDDDSGAVSNAFGSNIFDICICLSIPLFVNSYLTGWEPVSLLQGGKPIAGLVGLRILLVVLTVMTLAIMWHNRQLTRMKAIGLCALYLVFLTYAVVGSLESRDASTPDENGGPQLLRKSRRDALDLIESVSRASPADISRAMMSRNGRSSRNNELHNRAAQFIGAQQPGAPAVRLQPGGMPSMGRDRQISAQSQTVRVPHSYS